MRANVEIRHAHIDDAQALSELAIRTFTETFAQSWKPEALREYVSSSYSVDAMRKSLKDPHTTIMLAFPRGDPTPCGFATLLHDKRRPDLSPDDIVDTDEGCMELQKFYVDKPFHGKGVAQELMDRVLHEVRAARGEKAQRRCVVWLRVWENNLRAIQFYRNRGFQECGDVEIFDGFRDLVLEFVVDV
ncbi:hypothetical protein PINS_up019419 [Pythium insidiosum]|nr:hypothetical protein PINS_up019419 [Pythium insidiosum]